MKKYDGIKGKILQRDRIVYTGINEEKNRMTWFVIINEEASYSHINCKCIYLGNLNSLPLYESTVSLKRKKNLLYTFFSVF